MNYIKRTQNRIKTRFIACLALITSVIKFQVESRRAAKRMRTRFIAYLALFMSSITFGSGLLVFLYMKSPAFENQLLGQVMKHMDWIVENEFEKQIEKLKPRPVVDLNDENAWFWNYIKERNKKYIEWETEGKWK